MIEISGLEKIYQMGENVVPALRGVSLRIEDGDFVAIMGPSGSGKSTLTHILGLLDVPTAGSYRLNGREVSGLSEDELAVLRREEIGFIFQQLICSLASPPKRTFRFRSFTRNAAPAKRAEWRFSNAWASVHAPTIVPTNFPEVSSSGTAIARSLVNRPRMILADEPTGNLDSVSEREIMNALRELNEQGITVIIVTHEEEIGAQAKRLIRMRDGSISSDERREPLPERKTPPAERISTAKKGFSHRSSSNSTNISNKGTARSLRIRSARRSRCSES